MNISETKCFNGWAAVVIALKHV